MLLMMVGCLAFKERCGDAILKQQWRIREARIFENGEEKRGKRRPNFGEGILGFRVVIRMYLYG
jgi:hypothetical protein